ncbi:uncharacterized protein LOC134447400 [Engraulis encrasicolus]|uniref:uncharacterized protein LOC134447400 n=1 Tax=Engraulis encrasicolus TaxID=184585 RepID=UPI002FCFD0E8
MAYALLKPLTFIVTLLGHEDSLPLPTLNSMLRINFAVLAPRGTLYYELCHCPLHGRTQNIQTHSAHKDLNANADSTGHFETLGTRNIETRTPHKDVDTATDIETHPPHQDANVATYIETHPPHQDANVATDIETYPHQDVHVATYIKTHPPHQDVGMTAAGSLHVGIPGTQGTQSRPPHQEDQGNQGTTAIGPNATPGLCHCPEEDDRGMALFAAMACVFAVLEAIALVVFMVVMKRKIDQMKTHCRTDNAPCPPNVSADV